MKTLTLDLETSPRSGSLGLSQRQKGVAVDRIRREPRRLIMVDGLLLVSPASQISIVWALDEYALVVTVYHLQAPGRASVVRDAQVSLRALRPD